jgi:hypothetical protein
MSDGNISPLELVRKDMNMDDNDVTMHMSPPEGDPAHLAKDPDMTRDKLEKSGEFSQTRIGKIMESLPESSTPNDPLLQPTWTASLEVDVTFNKLYPKAMYAFSSPPPAPRKPPSARRVTRERSLRSQSPPHHPSHRHLRRNAIIPPRDPEPPTHHNNSTAVIKVPATTTRPSTPATTTSSPFMDLPGELKNRIYFYSLVKPDNMEITALNWPTHQPALLKTCKQIRHEALSIFYNENHICANIEDWSPVVKNTCHDLWTRHELDPTLFSHYFTGGPHWGNLLAWLKAFFLGTMRGISDVVHKTRSLERKTVGVTFMMAQMARINNLPWDDLKQMLEAQRGLLKKGDGRWAIDN